MEQVKSKIIKHLENLLEYVQFYNSMAPFPVFDTEYVEEIQKSIKKMKDNKYNDIPVAACKHCNSLHIINDEEENDVCMKCGAVNEIVIYNSIDDYFEKVGA